MMSKLLAMLAVVWLCGSLCACGGGDDTGPSGVPLGDRDASSDDECIDEDGDGFGRNCGASDCDDDDPEQTDECYRCTRPTIGCPCEPGTPAVACDPPDIEVEGGVLVCEEGTRYCRDGMWSDCEVVGEYVFQPLNN